MFPGSAELFPVQYDAVKCARNGDSHFFCRHSIPVPDYSLLGLDEESMSLMRRNVFLSEALN